MIIGNYLCSLFDGLTLIVNNNEVPIISTFDDQFALEKFMNALDVESLPKFPLIFCVTTKVTGSRNRTKRQIIIMTNTNPDWLSKDRTANTFTKVIHPIYQKIIPIIEQAERIQLIGLPNERIEYIDKTNYGIVKGAISKKNTDSESIVTDYVDARIIDLEFEYTDKDCCHECVIKP